MSSGWIPSSEETICANVVSCPWPCVMQLIFRIAFPVGWIRSSDPSFILTPMMS